MLQATGFVHLCYGSPTAFIALALHARFRLLMENSPIQIDETLRKYIPSIILERFAREHAVVSAPVSEPHVCALLFADIKGFTALTERLAAEGPAGVEELTGIINAYFSPLVDALLDHGGDIVKFAGDALITVWEAKDDDSLPGTLARAAEAALAVQQAVAGYTTPDGQQLGLKIAISAGTLHGAHLGGERGRWEFVLSGAPLTSVGEAADQCDAGEVVLEAKARALLDDRVTGESRDDGVFLVTEVGQNTTQMRHHKVPIDTALYDPLWTYVPGAIRARVQAGMDGMLGELRRITVVFATLPGHDRGLPLEQSQALVLALQRTLYRHEGSLNKLSVDDKGVSLLAALGLPPFAHDDDPARGVRVGLEMQAIFAQHGLQSRIGVATGRAFCGVVGSPRRCEYTMMGDVVNLAARLMVAATDGLLCDSTTYNSAEEQFEFEPLAALELKGKAEPVPVFRPLAERIGGTINTRSMVGRERERDRLANAMERLRAGRSSVLVIEGEAGIGKSRLLHEVHPLSGDDCQVLSGAADAVERATPYQAWRGVFAWMMGLDGVSDADARRQQVLDAIGDDAELQRLTPLINPLATTEFEDNDFTRDLVGEVRADNTHALAIALIKREAARMPLVLALEDSHWMDSASWALLRRVVREVEPALVVLATRPVEPVHQTGEYRELLSLLHCDHIELEALAGDDAIALVCQRIGARTLPDNVRDLILSKASGNPFFSEELGKGMLESGLIEVIEGECRVPQGVNLDDTVLPDNVHGAVTQRIDRLAPAPQLALKVASVIGRVFSFELLRDVFPLADSRGSLEGHLDRLVGLEVTELEAPKPHLAYIFKHIITQEVAYELMLFSQRRELHKAVAQWVERNRANDINQFLPLLAHHWKQAREPQKALEYLERAGDAALRANASEEAIRFFNDAVQLAEADVKLAPEARRGRWQQRLGEAYYALGRLTQAEQHLRAALIHYGFPFPRSLPRFLVEQAVNIGVQAAHRLAPGVFTGRKAADRERLLEVARADERLTQLSYMRNESVGTLFGGTRALNRAEAVGPSAELARNAANMSVVACICLLPALAKVYERIALETSAGLEDPACQSYVLEVVGIYHLGCGRAEPALSKLNPAIEIANKFADYRRLEECSLARGSVWLRTGKLTQAKDQFAELHASGARRDSPQVQFWGLGGQAAADAWNDQDPQVLLDLARTLADNRDHPGVARADKVWAFGLMAAAALQAGDEKTALSAARDVVTETNVWQMIAHYLLEGFAGAAEVFLTLWLRYPDRTDEFRGGARLMCEALRNHGITYPCARPQAARYRGLLHLCEGRTARAVKAWQRCITVSKAQGALGQEADAHALLAAYGPQVDAQTHRQLAAERLAQTGATRHSGCASRAISDRTK